MEGDFPMSNPTLLEEMVSLERNGRLVALAIYHLCELCDKGLISGGNIRITESGKVLGKAIAALDEFTPEEVHAAAMLVMYKTGGIQAA